jgi:hypothetical protein
MGEPGSYTTDTNDMRAVHGALRSAFGAADGLVTGAGTDPAKVDTVASFYETALEFLHVHHEGEDVLVYPILKERCPDRADLLARIDDQHALINEPLAQAREALGSWRADPGPRTGTEVIGVLGTIDVTMRPHFVDEEDEILPIASAYLAPEEWTQLPGHALRSMGEHRPWLALGLVREGLSDEQRARQLAAMPPPLQQLWTDDWEPRFTSFIAEVRAVAPPADRQ